MESFDLLPLLSRALDALDMENKIQGDMLALPSGLLLKPHLVNPPVYENGRYKTATAVEVHHPTLFERVFEYQYAFAQTPEQSLIQGFDWWAELDLVTLIDATREEPEQCKVMQASYLDNATGKEYVRQFLFGPTSQYRASPPDEAEEQEHPFCPCCLFTNSIEAFTDLIKGKDFMGIRFYAARDDNGECSADCRINGKDFEPAMPLLRDYAAHWPQAGLEFRKQYVVIRNKP